ncbi:7TM serpentine receptor class sx (Srsx) [Fusarium denticulatum]|uniref:7TM serpentine receptor class sx (Srsx) n=1 Tax=Fusarium denticulatum TaxID=48507 RepID=A0A8H5XC80_9HYPO|nr:7TM serpentine receptor class sx (Srsx) [Fusarium denticulatum]
MSHLRTPTPLPTRPRTVRPSLQPDASSQPPPSSQLPSSQSTSNRWTTQQHFFFMDLLLEARRDQRLNSKKKAVLKPVFESFVASLAEEFPAVKWDLRRVESRYTAMRDKYRVYLDMRNMTGMTENAEEGKVTISRQQAADLKQVYPRIAAGVIKDGLGVDEHITVDAWHEIFANDRPAGRYITEAGDDDAFARHNGMLPPSGERAASPGGSEQEEVRNSYPAEANSEQGGDELAEEDPEVEAPVQASQQVVDDPVDDPLPLPSSGPSQTPVTNSRKRTAATPIPPNDVIPFPRKKKTKTVNGSGDLHDLKELFLKSQSSTHNHVISPRPVGAEDLQGAIRDCTQLFMEDRGVDFVIKMTNWLREDINNALVWNSFDNKEMKEALANTVI